MLKVNKGNVVNIGIIGFGVVGSGVVSIIQEQKELIQKRRGINLNIKRIACKDTTKERSVHVDKSILTNDVDSVINDPSIDILVELVGGDIDFPYNILKKALLNKKHVVTANKSLLALRGKELFDIANKNKLELSFEASVGGGIPIITTIKDALAGDTIQSIYGIVNGTCNYILTKMCSLNEDYKKALREAKELGFAESDPSLDVNGLDSAYKIAILASFAFNTNIPSSFYHEGIEDIDLVDIAYAKELGYTIKLLAIAKSSTSGISVCVHPTLLPLASALAGIKNEYNAILLDSKFLGKSVHSGKGAGRYPTANAVIGDIIDVASHIVYNVEFNEYKNIHYEKKKIIPIKDLAYEYYIRFNTLDKSGILGQIANVFAKHKISIAQVIQKGKHKKNFVHLIFRTHTAREKDIQSALKELDVFENIIDRPTKLIRIINE